MCLQYQQYQRRANDPLKPIVNACYGRCIMLHATACCWWTKVDQGHEEFLRPNPLGLVVQDLVPKPGPKRVSRTLKSTRIKAMTMMTMSPATERI